MNGQEPITDTEGLLINVSGILLAILLGMSFLGNTTNRYLIFLSAISVILLVGCITLCLWYKHRIKLRKEIFSKLLNEFLKTFETSLTEFGELAEAQGKNDAQIFFREHGGLLKDKTPEEIKFLANLHFKSKDSNEGRSLVASLVAEGLTARFIKAHKESFQMPIDEQFSKIKCVLDQFANSYRFYFAIFGFLGFLVTVLVFILSRI